MSRKTALAKDEILVSFKSHKLQFLQLSQIDGNLQILTMGSTDFNIEDIYQKNYLILANKIKIWLDSQNIDASNIFISSADFYFFKKSFEFLPENKDANLRKY